MILAPSPLRASRRLGGRDFPMPGRRCGNSTAPTGYLTMWARTVPQFAVPTFRPSGQIGPRSGISTARRPCQCRGWLGVLPQNGLRQEQGRAVPPCSASAGERAEVW